jgi:SAM-dependent methyltransferase
LLFAMTPREIARENWTYRADAIERLCAAAPDSFPLVKCARCGFVYAQLLPPQEFLHTLYDDVIDLEAARSYSFGAESMGARMDYLAQLLPMLVGRSGQGATVLDFGCGFGPTLDLLALVKDLCAYGFETSAARVRELRTRHQDRILDNPAQVDAAASYDAIVVDNVLEHVPEPQACLRWLSRLCVPGGVVHIGVPDVNAARMARITEEHRAGRALGMDINPWEHLNYFDVDRLDGMARRCGFEPVLQSEMRRDVVTGLRPATRRYARLRNAAATGWRIARYVATGDAMRLPTRRLYRLRASS